MLERVLQEIGQPSQYVRNVFRIVETQQYAATSALVEDLEEQHLLESLLDEVKPPYIKGSDKKHYLISTPFRYPPLLHGSRFGNIMMPSYFYASENIQTMLSEYAYYRFVFFYDMATQYSKPINSEHMSFSVSVISNANADLIKVQSTGLNNALRSVNNYHFTQQLGQVLTQDGEFDMIRFVSARDKAKGVNVAITYHQLITSTQPENMTNWNCISTPEKISINCYGKTPMHFCLDDFTMNGKLPRPAAN